MDPATAITSLLACNGLRWIAEQNSKQVNVCVRDDDIIFDYIEKVSCREEFNVHEEGSKWGRSPSLKMLANP